MSHLFPIQVSKCKGFRNYAPQCLIHTDDVNVLWFDVDVHIHVKGISDIEVAL